MSTLDTSLNALNAQLIEAAGALTEARAALPVIQQAAFEMEKVPAQVKGQLGIAAVNMRDALIQRLRVLGVQPAWALDKVSALQLVADPNGDYTQDAQGNFQVA